MKLREMKIEQYPCWGPHLLKSTNIRQYSLFSLPFFSNFLFSKAREMKFRGMKILLWGNYTWKQCRVPLRLPLLLWWYPPFQAVSWISWFPAMIFAKNLKRNTFYYHWEFAIFTFSPIFHFPSDFPPIYSETHLISEVHSLRRILFEVACFFKSIFLVKFRMA